MSQLIVEENEYALVISDFDLLKMGVSTIINRLGAHTSVHKSMEKISAIICAALDRLLLSCTDPSFMPRNASTDTEVIFDTLSSVKTILIGFNSRWGQFFRGKPVSWKSIYKYNFRIVGANCCFSLPHRSLFILEQWMFFTIFSAKNTNETHFSICRIYYCEFPREHRLLIASSRRWITSLNGRVAWLSASAFLNNERSDEIHERIAKIHESGDCLVVCK